MILKASHVLVTLLLGATVVVNAASGQPQAQSDSLDESNFLPVVRSSSPAPIVWLEDGMTRVYRDDPARANADLTLYTAGNEYEPFQVVVKAPPPNDLTNVDVTVSDFTGPGGAVISADHVTLYREHYVHVRQGSKTHSTMTNPPLGPGWYPDALIPFTDPATGEDLAGPLDAVPFHLAAGKNQPIWVDVYTPAHTPAGPYSATATVSSDQGSRAVSVTLRVWNFSLPKTRSLKAFTNFKLSPRSRSNYAELLKHRFNPRWVARRDERFLIDNYGLDMVHVYTGSGASYGDCQTDPAPPLAEVLKATANHQPELYLFTSYANEVWECESLFPQFLGWAANLRQGGSHPMIVTYPVDALMGPDLDHTAADLWAILPKHYDQAKTNIQKLVAHPGTQVWSYNPLVQEGYSPKFTIDYLPINARIMQGFINQSLGFSGTKFWRVDNWRDDPWNNVDTYRVDTPGEAHMVYPGDDVGLPDQIISGVRMKWFREGSEDYEYVQILKELGQEQFALDVVRTVAVDFHTWGKDKDALYAARKALGDKIHVLNTLASLTAGKVVPTVAGPASATNGTVRFAVIGDYGKDNLNEARVAALVNGWQPDFVITTGDNNYPDGAAATIDANIGHYYSRFIGNYQGAYGPGSQTNRFWPALGNHDWHTITCSGSQCNGAYFDYFTLPHNERYYDVDLGAIHLFALDSDDDEPGGRGEDSAQATWLRNRLAASDSCHDIVFFHHPPYSSGRHGSIPKMRWPFLTWGADAVFTGHEHQYERLEVDGLTYFVNGAGGANLYNFENIGTLPPGARSLARYNQDHGAMLVTVNTPAITYQFYNAGGDLVDEYTIANDCPTYDEHTFLPLAP